jgi:kumamolisin
MDTKTDKTSSFFTVKELAQIYGFPAPTGSPVVGILSFGGGLHGVPQGQSTPYQLPVSSDGSDVQKYWTYLGYSTSQMPRVIICPINGAINDVRTTSNYETQENTLDVSILGGACPNPNMTILLFLFKSTSSVFSRSIAIALGGLTYDSVLYKPTILSISWGRKESSYLTSGQDTDNELTATAAIVKAAAERGVNICVASGDLGSTNVAGGTTLDVSFPASCPYVTAVGGTTLVCPTRIYADLATTSETVWNTTANGNGATGGGISAFFLKPEYQSHLNIKRTLPDIALNSDPSTGISLYVNNILASGYGGTSAAAPLFAAYLACLNVQVNVNALLYSSATATPTAFHDIVSGNNYSFDAAPNLQSYEAGPGFDACSGLGSINGSLLSPLLLQTPEPEPEPTPTPTPAPTPAPAPAPAIRVKSIKVSPPAVKLKTNMSTQLRATLLPANASNKTVVWQSSNSSVASVSATGQVTALLKGRVKITGQTTDGSNKRATANVTVVVGLTS